ncbi:ArsA family ATPase [Frisingicoccus sp.]|uniref:ArsA family ATPase n=1 Tax=Frisingicoccus sp. TaxID=1918627 RepID=UPI00260E831A|nr:ArsA family ATPase [Frisingicoccus sp.]MDD6232574.1 ArsA family ATPase [Frisingicoccus sp.]MDY4922363.1 ArsA family ATPase [Frisingicoccus sp.]
MGRIIIFTGKGGVGKTSVAAAHAIASANEGKNTLLVSADMAHNLGDIFQTEVGGHTKKVRDHLSLLELDPDMLMKEEFPNVNKAIGALMGSSGFSAGSVGDNFIIPGFENLFSLLKIRDIYESGEYDRIIVDCAPTGETLSLLKLPELLTWYMEKFFPVGKVMVRVLAPVSKVKYKVTLPTHKAMNEIEEMHGQMVLLQELLKDPEICSVRLVCVPEKMVVEETKRNFMYLNLYDYQVDRVFINRILPDETGSDFMNRWRDIQKKYIEEIEKVFTEVPVTKIPWYSEEVRGKEAIERLADDVLKISDLFAISVQNEKETYEVIDGGYCLTVKLPGADSDKVSVVVHDMDIDIKVNNYNRCIPLPNTLRGAQVTDVRFAENKLQISLKTKDVSEDAGKDVKQS